MHRVSYARRLVLKGGLAAGSLFLPMPHAWTWAQSEGTLKLLKLPKIALVIGNGGYKQAPLKNPANDARAIGEALKATGFEVALSMDADRGRMASAVQAYVQALEARKCVGLFYYAGHGIQIAWRNYMLPVDADIGTAADIPKQGLHVNRLLEGMTMAANPMNIIILDACRDNPFGSLNGVDTKGLSQMDAPQNTILAYATSPGNVASDGDGVNGLYTENLLRELKVPEAKVEDVFKRVRLNVRRKSNGAQIPWESTSLEEDFYFLPPRELTAQSEQEQERQFQEELELWERIKDATQAQPFEAYLRRFPSGRFTEIAWLRMDQLLAKLGERRIEIVSDAANPYSKGTARANTRFEVGERYAYRATDLYTKLETGRPTQTVTAITETEVVYNKGNLVTDLLGNELRLGGGREFTQPQFYPLEYAVGKKWSTRFLTKGAKGVESQAEMNFTVVGRENVTVPAGTFDSYRVEGSGWYGDRRQQQTTYWMAPEKVKRYIAREQIAYGGKKSKIRAAERRELVAFTPAVERPRGDRK